MKKALILKGVLVGVIFLAGGVVLGLEKSQQQIEQNFVQPVVQDIRKELPKIEFLNLKGKEIFSGTKNLEIKAEKVEGIEIQEIEIYLRNVSSLSSVFVARAERTNEGIFKLSFDTTNFPNGNYVISIKSITNLGEYEIEGGLIEINNRVEKETQRTEEMKKEIEVSQSQLMEREKVAETVVEEIKKEVKNKVEEMTRETPVKIEKREIEIEPEIEDLKKVVENEVSKGETPQIKKEKEAKKDEIVRKVIQPIEQKIEKLPEKEKEIALKKKEELRETIEQKLKESEVKLAQVAKAKKEISELSFKDSDEDGIYDWQEINLGTDPLNPDSDQDGFLDGIETKYGFDPKKPDPAPKMFAGNPEKEGKISERLSVEKIEIFEGKLKITGKGIPKSFVTLYVYSSPIIAMVKVNERGYFEYTLDKPLTDGTHTVYVTLTNNQGKVEEKSPSFTFVKTGDKVLRITELEAKVPVSPAQSLLNLFLMFTLATIVIALGIAFLVIGLAIRGKK